VDFDIPIGKIGDTTQQAIDRAADRARRYGHTRLTTDHLFVAVAQAEWSLLTGVLSDVGVNLRAVLAAVEEQVALLPSGTGELLASREAKLVCELALTHATRAGQHTIRPLDLLIALLEESHSPVVSMLNAQGVDPAVVMTRLQARASDLELRDKELQKRLELPHTLKQLATNLNLLARQDKLPPVFGRDREIQQVLEVLCHRERSNSVMLVGEPGVGKTAIVEGLARRLEFEPETVPVRLRDCQIVSLQMNALVAGTMLRGMFEERLQQVIREVKERPNLILFIDEAHTMVGAGSALGAPSDAANILKSVLARGEIRLIAATTLGEYKQHIQEDEALARRFRSVHVPEPTPEEARRILYNLRPRLERNYTVRITDDAIETAIEMAPRYMRHLHLPDKAVGWLDTAAVRAEVNQRWEVTKDDVLRVVSGAAQIPEDMVARDVADRFANLDQRLHERVVGQPDAIRAVAQRLVLNKGPLKDGFDRPDGVLLFLGPTGVGKTELAKALAGVLFGDEKKMVRIDMSEYQDGGVAVDKLIGMPRGIAGSERGGILTNQLADNPYTVVLLDEIEKASPNVLNVFLQAFDEGWLTDGRGRRVYLSDAIVIMTSNVGSEHLRKLTNPLGFRRHEVGGAQVDADIKREAHRRFAPEFLNRIDEIVIFNPLTRDDVHQIAVRYLGEVTRTLASSGRTLHIDDNVPGTLAAQGYSAAFGARFLKRVIDERVKLPISQRWRDGSRFHLRLNGTEIVVDAECVPDASVRRSVFTEQVA
jgi:ATP-dependent Clp protease ATP-binding subunit ClpA